LPGSRNRAAARLSWASGLTPGRAVERLWVATAGRSLMKSGLPVKRAERQTKAGLLRCAGNDDLILRDRKQFQSAAADTHENATA
jgi:hypothetical protein